MFTDNNYRLRLPELPGGFGCPGELAALKISTHGFSCSSDWFLPPPQQQCRCRHAEQQEYLQWQHLHASEAGNPVGPEALQAALNKEHPVQKCPLQFWDTPLSRDNSPASLCRKSDIWNISRVTQIQEPARRTFLCSYKSNFFLLLSKNQISIKILYAEISLPRLSPS